MKDPCPKPKCCGVFRYNAESKKIQCDACGFLCRRQGNSVYPAHMERRGADEKSRTWEQVSTNRGVR